MTVMSNASGFCFKTIGLMLDLRMSIVFVLDLMPIVFVLDTGSSDHICKIKELFVGDIVKLENVKLQVKG